jgi:hypothetical protein
MTKKEFLQICKKYNLVTKQDKDLEGSIYISAYIPGMEYELDDGDNDSFADFVAESWDDDSGHVQMYGGLITEYNAIKHTTEYNYYDIHTVDTTVLNEFEQIVSGVMERYTAMKLLDKKDNERNKLIKMQTDFV